MIMSYIYTCWLGIAAVGGGQAIDTITQQGANLGSLSSAAIWAVIALISVVGLTKLYVDKQKDDEDLKGIIKETTAAITKNTETLDKLGEKIDSCPKK